jgi:hypothetical protein
MYYKFLNIARWPLLLLLTVLICEDYIPVKVDLIYTLPKVSVKITPVVPESQGSLPEVIQASLLKAIGSNIRAKWSTAFSEIEFAGSR